MTTAQQTEIEKIIRINIHTLFQSIQQLDIEKALKLYWEGDEFTHTGNGTVSTGKKTFADMLRTVISSIKSIDSVDIDALVVNVLAEDAALCVTEFRERLTLANNVSFTLQIAHTTIWQKKQGVWKIIHESSSSKPA